MGLQRIKELISILPKKDADYAKKFIHNQDYEKLFELVSSILELSDTRDVYKNISSTELMELYTEIVNYENLLATNDLTHDYD